MNRILIEILFSVAIASWLGGIGYYIWNAGSEPDCNHREYVIMNNDTLYVKVKTIEQVYFSRE